jgi:hypothetical protein
MAIRENENDLNNPLMRNARQCNLCGYVTEHPETYCPKCPGKFHPVIMRRAEFLSIKQVFIDKEKQESKK